MGGNPLFYKCSTAQGINKALFYQCSTGKESISVHLNRKSGANARGCWRRWWYTQPVDNQRLTAFV